jgi:hypothetical protein
LQAGGARGEPFRGCKSEYQSVFSVHVADEKCRTPTIADKPVPTKKALGSLRLPLPPLANQDF